MLNHGKESGDYLAQIRNNSEEKTEILGNAIASGKLPTNIKGKMIIVELGTGGGESLRRLKQDTAGIDNLELIAVDIIPSLAASLKKETNVESLAADAGNLPFEDNSLSAVNASAIFHEISSYGTKAGNKKEASILYGRPAIEQTLQELNRVLLPGGVVGYRDVLAPREGIGNNKKVNYKKRSWQLFANWFLEAFLNAEPKVYEKDKFKVEENGQDFSLTAPAGLHRELQRHYLMLRDYFLNVKSNEYGINLIRADWIDQSAGLKAVTFTVSDALSNKLDLSRFEKHTSNDGDVYRGDSDDFDRLFDESLEDFFASLNQEDGSAKSFQGLINGWKEREGLEHYLYGNFTDLFQMSIQAGKKSAAILLPSGIEDVAVAPRDYYNRYLRQVIDSPEEDGKQILALRKQTKQQAFESLDAIIKSPRAVEFFNIETLRKLQSQLQVQH
ncbi:MAG: class I SAM-dependent methyltransferase [Candidatus Doudnabacteria bacterium]|nr:class I SAM-dependent methyltransferase [Candidatus Doudnabacteria bacterium]